MMQKFFYFLVKCVVYVPIAILHPTRMYGKKNRPKGKAILALNHRSNWDIVLFLNNTFRKIKILAKRELFKNKFFGAILRFLGGIEIDRSKSDIGAIKKCFEALKNNDQLLIFPEGTRLANENEILGEFKGGTALIAIKTKSPIVPVWIEKKPRLFRISRYHFGKPFELSQFYGQKLDEKTMQEADQIIREKMLEVRESVQKK